MPERIFRPLRKMNVARRLRYELVRRTFTGHYRQPFYETLRFLLENKKPLAEALKMIGEVHTDFGRHWHPYSDLVEDCLEALADNSAGRSLQDVLAAWVPREEAAIISAGMRSGHQPRALVQADKLIVARRRILGQAVLVSVYPCALTLLGGGLLGVNTFFIIPTLSKLSSPDHWTGALGFMDHLSLFTGQYGPFLTTGFVALTGLVFGSLSRWCGQLRRIADRFMPWSIYKDLQGAVFLMNVAALIGAGVPELSALEILHSFGSRWLRERLEGAMDCVNMGDGLGQALRNCGYQFPSQEAANYLSLLGAGDGAAGLISHYADRWLEQALKKVARRANAAKFFSLLLIISFFLLILGMAMQIQDMTRYSPH